MVQEIAAWQWAKKKLYRIRGTYLESGAAFFKSIWNWHKHQPQLSIQTTEFIVDSNTSMYMMSKTDLSPEELEHCVQVVQLTEPVCVCSQLAGHSRFKASPHLLTKL